ncbi:MAG: hypothetical protein ACI9M6_000361, partial [Hydrogenophaga sp.]
MVQAVAWRGASAEPIVGGAALPGIHLFFGFFFGDAIALL